MRAASYLYGKYHQGLPIGTVNALRALLLSLANVTGAVSAASAEAWWTTDRHARRAAFDTCYRLFLPFCAAACERAAAHRPPAARRPTSPQDVYTTGPPRTPWFVSTLNISGRTQREWRADLAEWRNCLCLE